MATDPDNVYETCTAAADLIERDGWVQGMFFGDPVAGDERRSPMCTLGALRAAVGQVDEVRGRRDNWSYCGATRAVKEEIAAREPSRVVVTNAGAPIGVDVGGWNDDRRRTKDEVVSLLRDVAAKHQPDEYRSTPGGGGSTPDGAVQMPGGSGA